MNRPEKATVFPVGGPSFRADHRKSYLFPDSGMKRRSLEVSSDFVRSQIVIVPVFAATIDPPRERLKAFWVLLALCVGRRLYSLAISISTGFAQEVTRQRPNGAARCLLKICILLLEKG